MQELQVIYENLISENRDNKVISDQLLVFIFKNPSFFNLGSMDKDYFFDLLMYIRPQLLSLVRNFDPQKGSLENLLKKCVYYAKNKVLWKKTRKLCKENILYTIESDEYWVHQSSNVLIYHENPTVKTSMLKTFLQYANTSISPRIKPSVEEGLHIFLLKNIFYVSYDTYEAAYSILFPNSENAPFLYETCINSLDKKITRRNQLYNTLNRTYFDIRHYEIMITSLDEKSEMFSRYQKRLNELKMIRQQRLKQLNGKRDIITVSNVLIGNLLNISPRHVIYAYNLAIKYMDKFLASSYICKHENLLSDRKPE